MIASRNSVLQILGRRQEGEFLRELELTDEQRELLGSRFGRVQEQLQSIGERAKRRGALTDAEKSRFLGEVAGVFDDFLDRVEGVLLPDQMRRLRALALRLSLSSYADKRYSHLAPYLLADESLTPKEDEIVRRKILEIEERLEADMQEARKRARQEVLDAVPERHRETFSRWSKDGVLDLLEAK